MTLALQVEQQHGRVEKTKFENGFDLLFSVK